MDSNALIARYAQRIEKLLIQHYGATGSDLPSRIASVAEELPPELLERLRELATLAAGSADRLPSDEEIAEFVFRCGQIGERLETDLKAKASENLIFVGTDGRTVTDPEKADLDALTRFLTARDRLLRKAADISLKILVIGVLLLIAGFLIGVI